MLRRVSAQQAVELFGRSNRSAVDAQTLRDAGSIVEDVRTRGGAAVREHAERLGDIEPGGPLLIGREAMDASLSAMDAGEADALRGAAGDIGRFALAQRASVQDFDVSVEGGRLRQMVAPVGSAGCYAPGGRYPLPSSVLMTAVTARAAGVGGVVVASPRPAPATLAAASIAGADALLAGGGAQGSAALAFGIDGLEPCDAICGPGNRWVTAAKQLVSGTVRIDMLAGPSEVLVIADDSADADTVAADLLAQAEHDADARANLVTTSPGFADAVDERLRARLETLPTAGVAGPAIERSVCVVAGDIEEAIRLSDLIAPEHLEIHTRDAPAVAARCRHYGAVFVGSGAAEVLGDYGIGPNHTLPTGGTARGFGGLSVFDFLRVRTGIELDRSQTPARVYERAARLARMEGLEAHARSAEARL